jgi:hypothetical protein
MPIDTPVRSIIIIGDILTIAYVDVVIVNVYSLLIGDVDDDGSATDTGTMYFPSLSSSCRCSRELQIPIVS